MWSTRILAVVVMAVLVASNTNAAKRDWPNTCQSILESELIIWGRVLKVEEDTAISGGGSSSRIAIAIVQVEKTIKGSHDDKVVRAVANPITMGDRIKILQGMSYVLMLTPYQHNDNILRKRIYIPTHHGYGSSIAGLEEVNGQRLKWPAPLRFYYHRNTNGSWVTKDFGSVQEYIQEIKRVIAIQKEEASRLLPPCKEPA